ncbi:MAG TPA: TolC family protein [Edaphobacter sp.]|nr:TolC family protein [Edaphobacter sp.]
MPASPDTAFRTIRFHHCASRLPLLACAVVLAFHSDLRAQAPATGAGAVSSPAAPATGTPITLEEAIRRAQTSDVAFRTAAADKTVAAYDKTIARSTLLPGVVYHNQYIYTQGVRPLTPIVGTTTTPPIFIANNAIHEYISQGAVTETIGVAAIANYRSLSATAEASAARLEVARRGLVATVIFSYFNVLAAERKLAVAQRSVDEAQQFSDLTLKLESGREVAHADVVKADLQLQQRRRELADAGLAAEKARLDLAVLLFPNPLTPYTLTNDLDQPSVLPTKDEVQADGAKNNPDLRAALQASRAAKFELTAAKAAYLPDLSLAYFYGIDATNFAVNAHDGSRNLGYSAVATIDIPVWDWFATHSRVKQSAARNDLAKVELTATQRQLIASIEELYNEAAVAVDQIASFGETVRTAAESLRLTKMRYSAGEATVLEVVDAQTSYRTAQAAQVDAAVRYHVAFGQLQTLTGKLQ